MTITHSEYWKAEVKKVVEITREYGYDIDFEFWNKQSIDVISLIIDLYEDPHNYHL